MNDQWFFLYTNDFIISIALINFYLCQCGSDSPRSKFMDQLGLQYVLRDQGHSSCGKVYCENGAL